MDKLAVPVKRYAKITGLRWVTAVDMVGGVTYYLNCHNDGRRPADYSCVGPLGYAVYCGQQRHRGAWEWNWRIPLRHTEVLLWEHNNKDTLISLPAYVALIASASNSMIGAAVRDHYSLTSADANQMVTVGEALSIAHRATKTQSPFYVGKYMRSVSRLVVDLMRQAKMAQGIGDAIPI